MGTAAQLGKEDVPFEGACQRSERGRVRLGNAAYFSRWESHLGEPAPGGGHRGIAKRPAAGELRKTRRARLCRHLFLNHRRLDVHRPHRNKEALKYRVKAVREFLISAGIQP